LKQLLLKSKQLSHLNSKNILKIIVASVVVQKYNNLFHYVINI